MLLGSSVPLLHPRGEVVFSLGFERCLGGGIPHLISEKILVLNRLILSGISSIVEVRISVVGLSGTGFVGSQ